MKMCLKKLYIFFINLVCLNQLKLKKCSLLIVFLMFTSIHLYAQELTENFQKFQKEYTQLENATQAKLAQLQADFDKDSQIITQSYQLEMSKLTKEYEGKLLKNTSEQKKYQKEAGKITSKYDLQMKDLMYRFTVQKAKIENDFYHEKNKLMKKHDIYLDE